MINRFVECSLRVREVPNFRWPRDTKVDQKVPVAPLLGTRIKKDRMVSSLTRNIFKKRYSAHLMKKLHEKFNKMIWKIRLY